MRLARDLHPKNLRVCDHGISLVLFVVGLRHLGTARRGAYYSVAPFFGAVLAVILLHERLSLKLGAAGALMAFGLRLHLTEKHVHPHMHPPVGHEHEHTLAEHHLHQHPCPVAPGTTHTHIHEPMTHTHEHGLMGNVRLRTSVKLDSGGTTELVKEQTKRFRSRLYIHHIPLFSLSLISVVGLYATRPYKDVLSRLSFATAYPALILLVLTLLIGPSNLLLKRRTPISSDLRRDVGIWAGILGLLHALIGQNVHLRGRPWLYYLYEQRQNGPSGLRHDLFGFNNFTGLAGTLVLILLLVTSNDWSLRRLGTPRWKQFQRWNYLCFALSGAHAIGYQVMEKQKAAFVETIVSCITVTLILQSVGVFLRRQQRLV